MHVFESPQEFVLCNLIVGSTKIANSVLNETRGVERTYFPWLRRRDFASQVSKSFEELLTVLSHDISTIFE